MHDDGIKIGPLFMDPIENENKPEDPGTERVPIRLLTSGELRAVADLLDKFDEVCGEVQVHATIIDDNDLVLGEISEHLDYGDVFFAAPPILTEEGS